MVSLSPLLLGTAPAAVATVMEVFYLQPNSTASSPYVDAMKDSKGRGRFSSVCAGNTHNDVIRDLPTSFTNVVLEHNPNIKIESTRAILAILYSTCKNTIYDAVNNTNVTKADISILKDLMPSKKSKTSLTDMVNTWFNNVDIYFEGTGSMRRLQTTLSMYKQGDMDMNLWMYVENADVLLRRNSHHIHMRVMSGEWQGYYEYMAASQWANANEHREKMTKPEPVTPDNVLVLAVGRASTQVVTRIGELKLDGVSEQQLGTDFRQPLAVS
jgi:hypothetical protein